MLDILKEALFLENGRCPVCKRVLFFTEDHLCSKCVKGLEEVAGKVQGDDWENTSIEKVYAPYLYEGSIKDIVHLMKFGNRPGLCAFMGELVGGHISGLGRPDFEVIMPVPLHENSLKERGYNQSEMMAKGIFQKVSQISSRSPEVDLKALAKVKDTLHQRDLKKSERLVNLKDAFEVKNPEAIRGRRVLLVDDVFTTGATVRACSKELLKAGAVKVSVGVLARVEK
jgi:ComF family protein